MLWLILCCQLYAMEVATTDVNKKSSDSQVPQVIIDALIEKAILNSLPDIREFVATKLLQNNAGDNVSSNADDQTVTVTSDAAQPQPKTVALSSDQLNQLSQMCNITPQGLAHFLQGYCSGKQDTTVHDNIVAHVAKTQENNNTFYEVLQNFVLQITHATQTQGVPSSDASKTLHQYFTNVLLDAHNQKSQESDKNAATAKRNFLLAVASAFFTLLGNISWPIITGVLYPSHGSAVPTNSTTI